MSSIWKDVRFAVRTLVKSRGFAAAAVLSFALGIGANTTIFTFVNAIFLRPVPVERPDRLISVYTLDRNNPGFFFCSYPNYLDYRSQNQVFEDLLLYSTVSLNLAGGGAPEEILGQLVTANYFSLLGVRPELGRGFLPAESAVPGAAAVAVISHALWTRRFGGAPDVLGRTITLNRRVFTVVGVAPPEFHGLNALVASEAWVPLGAYDGLLPLADLLPQRRALLFNTVGRLLPGVTEAGAQAALQTIAGRLAAEYPKDNGARSVVLLPLNEAVIAPNLRGTFVLAGGVLMGVVALVLLIACANVANLLLARAAARHKEIAVRVSLGASRWRLVRQLVAESVVIALAGGGIGLLLARWGRSLLWNARPEFLRYGSFQPALDGRVLGFTLAVALATGIVFGLAPALHATRTELAIDLKDRGSQGGGAGRAAKVRGALIVLQVALSVMALVGAGLFLKSLRYAEHIDPGFETARLAVLSFNLESVGYSPARGREFERRLLEQVRALPGVRSAALSTESPFHVRWARKLVPEGDESGGPGALVLLNWIEPDYFQTLRIALESGRTFNAFDAPGSPRVAVVNEALAQRYWQREPPVGRRFRLAPDPEPYQVVGVVRNSNYLNLGEAPRSMVYLPLAQGYAAAGTLFVYATGSPEVLLQALTSVAHGLEPELVLTGVRTLPDIIARALWAPRLGAGLLAAFGALALLLAAVGIYGVVSYSVAQRVRELGIRMALGAQPIDVVRQVLREGMQLVGWGLLLGWVGAYFSTRSFSKLLFGVGAADLPTFAGVSVLFAAVALLACYVPARRATRLDPMLALRAE